MTAPDVMLMHTAPFYRFMSLAEMVATADLVAEVEVVSVARDETVWPDSSASPRHGSRTDRLAAVKVLQVFSGDAPATIVITENGWGDQGARFVTDGWPGLEVGDRVIAFLARGKEGDSPRYWALKSTAKALVASEDAPVLTGQPTDPAGEQIRLLNPPALRAAIVEAKRQVDETGMKPLNPGDNMGVAKSTDVPEQPDVHPLRPGEIDDSKATQKELNEKYNPSGDPNRTVTRLPDGSISMRIDMPAPSKQ